jgi:hypothetical protein
LLYVAAWNLIANKKLPKLRLSHKEKNKEDELFQDNHRGMGRVEIDLIFCLIERLCVAHTYGRNF